MYLRYLQFSQKTNENIRLYYTLRYLQSNCFRSFFGSIVDTKRHFEINWPSVIIMVRPLDIRKSRLLFPPEFLLEFLKNFMAPNKIPTWKVEKYLRLLVGEGKDIIISSGIPVEKAAGYAFWMACRNVFFILWAVINLDRSHHGLRTPRENFFSKIPNFWAWADILGCNVLRHLECFLAKLSTNYFDTVKPLSIEVVLGCFSYKKTFVFQA